GHLSRCPRTGLSCQIRTPAVGRRVRMSPGKPNGACRGVIAPDCLVGAGRQQSAVGRECHRANLITGLSCQSRTPAVGRRARMSPGKPNGACRGVIAPDCLVGAGRQQSAIG
ncbi:uncharacterized protein N7511_008416, partial [Penicillium nucicola]|uniref:uncharacterized protein n=1 Tax=Penicillium nucicola TaxID=1850975 RepID=UPI002545A99E